MANEPRQSGRPKRGAPTVDREMIGRATIEVLIEHGATDLTISKIANVLGVRSQTLYYHVNTLTDAVNAARGVLLHTIDLEPLRRARDRDAWCLAVVDFAEHYARLFLPLGQANNIFFLHEITDEVTLRMYDTFLKSALDAGVGGEDAIQLLLDLEHAIFSLVFEQSSWHTLFSREAIDAADATTLSALLSTRNMTPEKMIEHVRQSAALLVRGAFH